MKKILLFTAGLLIAAFALSGCSKSIKYSDYISEKRTDIYLYAGDDTQIKIYCSLREQPYAADGIKGDMSDFIEIFVSLPKNPETLEVDAEGLGGEMNYRAVENDFYLSFTAQPFKTESVAVKLDCDGKTSEYTVQSVKSGALITCEQALNCVIDHDKSLFTSLTDGNLFEGEIYVRLLYDNGCYYYVGVCDRDKNINAYLVDGERGKIITSKKIRL
ncbi:MAG: hypothetical protein J1G07_04560 [Clostridiales bacterium]|nr:hypothetical protein [Clostridiales bacterium]